MGVELEATVKDNFSPTIKKWNDELGHVADAVNGLNRSVDDQAKIMGSQAAAIAKNRDMLREMARAEEEAKNVKAASRDETQKLSDALADQILKLKAQKDLLQDPVFTANLRRQQSLRAEINQMTSSLTEVTGAHVAEKEAIEAGDEAVKLTVRSRRELIVLAHELSQGRFKNFGGSLMVLEEGQGGILGAVKAASKAIYESVGPAGLAAGALAALGVVTYEVTEHYIKLSEAAAENYHKIEQLGDRAGMTAETMRGLEYATLNTGVKSEEVARAIAMLSVRMDEHREAFARLGVTSKDPLTAFEQLIDAANRAGTESQRNAILNEGLGKSWQTLSPIVIAGGDALRDSIEKGKLPADVKADFEAIIEYKKLMAKADFEADAAAASHASHMAAQAAKMEAAAAAMRAAHGNIIGRIMNWADILGRPDMTYSTRGEVMVDEQVAEDAKRKTADDARAKSAGIGAPLTEKQQDALDKGRKRVAKDSLASEIAETKNYYQSLAAEFVGDSKIYQEKRKELAAEEAIAEDEVRKKWAKKGAGSRGPSESQIETNVARNFDGSVTMRSGLEYEAGPDAEHLRNRAMAERTDDKNGNKKAALALKNHNEMVAEESRYSLELLAAQRQGADAVAKEEESQYSYSFSLQSKAMQKRLAADAAFDTKELALKKKQAKDEANLEKASGKDPLNVETALQHRLDRLDADMSLRKIKRDQEVLEAKKKHWREYADVAQSLGQKELSSALKGELTRKQALEDVKNAAIGMIAERTTKAIEGMLEEAIFGKASAATTAAVTSASMAAISAAAAPAAAGVSLATLGANSAPAMAGIGSAYSLTSSLSAFAAGMPHERGGMMFGTGLKQREEQFTPLFPGRVSPIQNSTTTTHHNTTNAQQIHVHVYGSDERSIMRTLKNAGINGSGSSRR